MMDCIPHSVWCDPLVRMGEQGREPWLKEAEGMCDRLVRYGHLGTCGRWATKGQRHA